MQSLRLWIGVVTIPALAGYTLAVVQEQQQAQCCPAMVATTDSSTDASPAPPADNTLPLPPAGTEQ